MIVAIATNFLFGILTNFGVGNYAPTLVLLSLMGMDPRLCFPIMATAGALGGPGRAVRHLAIGEIDLRIVIGVALGGIPAVLVAAFIVRIDADGHAALAGRRWSCSTPPAVMLRAALLGRRGAAEPPTCAEPDAAQALNRAASSEPPVVLPSE